MVFFFIEPALRRAGSISQQTWQGIDGPMARSPLRRLFPFVLSAQQPCPVPSMGKRRVTASSPSGPVSSA